MDNSSEKKPLGQHKRFFFGSATRLDGILYMCIYSRDLDLLLYFRQGGGIE